MEELEQSVNDVSESSSDSTESLNSGSENKQNLSSETKSEPKPSFTGDLGEHPRFKELVEQKNRFADQVKDYESRLKDLQTKYETLSKPKAEPSPEAKLIERLKGIDPEFGAWAENIHATRAKLEQMEQWRAQIEQQNYLNSARSTAERLQSELKVDKDLHDMYLSKIPMGTPVDKIAELYKAQHSKIESIFEARKRDALSKYTEGKKADAKVPAPSKGSSAKPAQSQQKPKYSSDPIEARAQIVSETMKAFRSHHNN